MNTSFGFPQWLTAWNWQPQLIIGIVIVMGLYIAVTGPLRVKYHLGPEVPMRRLIAFLLGIYCIFIALFSPLDSVGEAYLFSAHMVQHMILALFAPPLLLLGLPAWFFSPVLRNRFSLHIGTYLTNPFVTSLLFNGNLWIWHAPPIYNAALINQPLHEVSHLLYIGTGLLFWWPIVSPLHEGLPPLSLGKKLAYLFFSDMPMVLLGAGLTFTPSLYVHYQYAPHIFGISANTDQQIGGLVMWIIGSIFLIVVVSIFFLRWMLQQERAEREHEATLL